MRHRVNNYRSFFFYLSALIYIASFVLAGASPNLLLLFFAFLLGCLFLYPCLGLKKSALDSPAFLYLFLQWCPDLTSSCRSFFLNPSFSSHVAWYDVLICSHLASIKCSSRSVNVWYRFCRALQKSWRWSGESGSVKLLSVVVRLLVPSLVASLTFRLAIINSWSEPASAPL